VYFLDMAKDDGKERTLLEDEATSLEKWYQGLLLAAEVGSNQQMFPKLSKILEFKQSVMVVYFPLFLFMNESINPSVSVFLQSRNIKYRWGR
jgi:hypothetical protein